MEDSVSPTIQTVPCICPFVIFVYKYFINDRSASSATLAITAQGLRISREDTAEVEIVSSSESLLSIPRAIVYLFLEINSTKTTEILGGRGEKIARRKDDG